MHKVASFCDLPGRAEIAAQMRTLKSSIDCTDTVMAGRAFHSWVADGKMEACQALTEM